MFFFLDSFCNSFEKKVEMKILLSFNSIHQNCYILCYYFNSCCVCFHMFFFSLSLSHHSLTIINRHHYLKYINFKTKCWKNNLNDVNVSSFFQFNFFFCIFHLLFLFIPFTVCIHTRHSYILWRLYIVTNFPFRIRISDVIKKKKKKYLT